MDFKYSKYYVICFNVFGVTHFTRKLPMFRKVLIGGSDCSLLRVTEFTSLQLFRLFDLEELNTLYTQGDVLCGT